MSEQEIKTGNILIALFMGWTIDNSFPDKERVYRLGSAIEMDTTFKFHSSLDWIIPFVQKIDKLGYYMSIEFLTDNITNITFDEREDISNCISCAYQKESHLEGVWVSVLDFIKYHNSIDK